VLERLSRALRHSVSHSVSQTARVDCGAPQTSRAVVQRHRDGADGGAGRPGGARRVTYTQLPWHPAWVISLTQRIVFVHALGKSEGLRLRSGHPNPRPAPRLSRTPSAPPLSQAGAPRGIEDDGMEQCPSCDEVGLGHNAGKVRGHRVPNLRWRQGLTRHTIQLNLSALYETGGARRGCVARVKGC